MGAERADQHPTASLGQGLMTSAGLEWGSGSMGQAVVCGMESLHLGIPISYLKDFPDLL